MKKRMMVVLLCLSMVLSVTACQKKQQEQESDPAEERRSNVIETDSETGEKYYLLGDFENYYECSQVKYEAAFGKVTEIKKSENPDFVTYGDQSVKLEIQGNSTQWGVRQPMMRFSTATDYFNLTEDFSNMTRFTFDIYNDMDYEVTVRFAVDDSVGESRGNYHFVGLELDENRSDNIATKIDLKPKQWNHVEIPVEEIKVKKENIMTYGQEGLYEVGGFVIVFDRGELHDEQQVYYLDNVRAYFEE